MGAGRSLPPPPPPPAPTTGAGMKPPEEWTDEELHAYATQRGRLTRALRDVAQNESLVAGLALIGFFLLLGLYELFLHGDQVGTLPFNGVWALNDVTPIGPTREFPFGILAGFGVDLYAALGQATPWDLLIFGSIILGSFAIGSLLGTYAGYVGGFGDSLLTGFSDIVLAIPPFFFVVILYIGISPLIRPFTLDLPVFILLFIFVLFPYYARPIRARAERVSREPYVEAARAAGASKGRILRGHVYPNSLSPAFAQMPVDLFNIFFVLTLFPLLGCYAHTGHGTQYAFTSILPNYRFPEWGNLLAWGACYGWSPIPATNWWWMYFFPAVVILIFGLAVTLACDGMEKLMHGRT
jgi:peptide/nickel transport system permease protein